MSSFLVNTTVGVAALFCSLSSLANPVEFSVGTGYPFFGQLEVSVPQAQNQSKWYGSYRIGLDDGLLLGYERAVSANNKHAVGVVAGALGARDVGPACEEDDDVVCGIFEPIINLFDDETTNGVGLSYSYYFSSINQRGWHVKFIAGYGESSDSNKKRADGSVAISYQF
ncbi:hypothetical protein [Pseudoalteromonas peptidolytica]|uniref:Outer membrane protein beta-barrel domain-containing protein n=1 Tax=Pseudoalteromonas peptidolytica F12-50-A1 TaxID=1315280 RepID=A0A8I0T6G8_9GAMM|nr:hypothetical protein [Pseudoalteromonas peptidolytica]MBE0348407.1 hypothetical protein [Pseudoalteromonas peptidolytica F12-50-A1]NLR15005.1 hypothetical protein [Pseudoalteromonas peptidolytica]GEK09640.1 hypothetical protein PPE03_18890 [Pseudoalteromonas peptidolytica]